MPFLRPSRQRAAALVALAILVATAATLWAMGRNPICTCGDVDLWVPGKDSPRLSQMIADWYSLSHIVHGFLFYGVLWVVARRCPAPWRLVIAMLIEAGWEILENTPMVINRYREATVALGYTGDSILNSLSDIAMMMVGFWLARRLAVRTSVALVIVMELAALIAIRDNLTLNVWMLVAPSDAIRAWQAGG